MMFMNYVLADRLDKAQARIAELEAREAELVKALTGIREMADEILRTDSCDLVHQIEADARAALEDSDNA